MYIKQTFSPPEEIMTEWGIKTVNSVYWFIKSMDLQLKFIRNNDDFRKRIRVGCVEMDAYISPQMRRRYPNKTLPRNQFNTVKILPTDLVEFNQLFYDNILEKMLNEGLNVEIIDPDAVE